MSSQPTSPPPQAVLSEMINGYWLTFSLVAAAELGVADRIGEAPVPIGELALRTEANEDALFRLLRALAARGIFTEHADRSFGHSPLSLALRRGVPGSMWGLAAVTGRLHLRAWPEIVHTMRTGETSVKKVFGKPIFAHVAEHPEVASAFDAAMAGYTAAAAAGIVRTYDFSGIQTLVDVGGGNGSLLAAVLPKYPAMNGVNLDLPHVVARAPAHERVTHVAADFLTQPLPVADAYAMKLVLHDWDDARSLVILRQVRAAIRPDGKLLVMEAVLPEDGTGAESKLFDVNMLVMTGGRERTAKEFRELFAQAGFTLTRIVPITPMLSVVEGVPVA